MSSEEQHLNVPGAAAESSAAVAASQEPPMSAVGGPKDVSPYTSAPVAKKSAKSKGAGLKKVNSNANVVASK